MALIHVETSDGTPPGQYRGVLTIRLGVTSVQRPISIEVLPFELMRPSKQYAVSRVPMGEGEWCEPDLADSAAFRRLRALGIGALCLAAPPTDRAVLEATMSDAGLRGPVLAPAGGERQPAPVTTAIPASPAAGSTPPSGSSKIPQVRSHTLPGIRWYLRVDPSAPPSSTGALESGGASLRAGRVESLEQAGKVDLPIFAADSDAAERLLRTAGRPGAGVSGWWSWEAGAASPMENRLRCGALLWKCGLSGALIEISPAATADPGWPLRWEGICQGIQDARYLTTLAALTRQLKDKDRSSPLSGQAEGAIAAALNEQTAHPSMEAADHLRDVATNWIRRLGRVVGY